MISSTLSSNGAASGLPPHDSLFDDTTHEVVDGDKRVYFTPRQWDILQLLRRHPGQFISLDRLHTALYANEAEARDDSAIRAHLSHINRRLAGTPIRIACRWNFGWRLERTAP